MSLTREEVEKIAESGEADRAAAIFKKAEEKGLFYQGIAVGIMMKSESEKAEPKATATNA